MFAGCSSRISDPGFGFFPIPDPGVKKSPDPGSEFFHPGTSVKITQKGLKSRIRISIKELKYRY
jgi:hypothetical protein